MVAPAPILSPLGPDHLDLLINYTVGAARPSRAKRTQPAEVGYEPRGAAREFFDMDDRLQEIFFDGPAGTGKTLSILWRFHLLLNNFPNSRALILRKTHVSLTGSALESFRRYVLSVNDFGATWYGGSAEEPPGYRYPNGSKLNVGGLDNPTRVMSAEYDGIFVNEATELTEEEWESLITRRRLGVWPMQILVGDANPQAPTHWYNHRADLPGKEGNTRRRLLSRYEDNPRYWNLERNDWTQEGRDYVLGTLGALTGVRYKRLRLGLWVAAEGQVYETWDPATHLVSEDRFAERLKNAWHIGSGDWGWTKPGVLQVWAVDGDGRMYRRAEIYRTGEHVDPWWMERAAELDREFAVTKWVFDPSEPANIAKMKEAGLNAHPANNAIVPGIQAVDERLKPQAGEPRLYLLRDTVRYPDDELVRSRKPASSEQEFGEYVWPRGKTNPGGKERPVSENDHGMDSMRYAVAELDLGGRRQITAPEPITGGTLFRARDAFVVREEGTDDDDAFADDPWAYPEL